LMIRKAVSQMHSRDITMLSWSQAARLKIQNSRIPGIG